MGSDVVTETITAFPNPGAYLPGRQPNGNDGTEAAGYISSRTMQHRGQLDPPYQPRCVTSPMQCHSFEKPHESRAGTGCYDCTNPLITQLNRYCCSNALARAAHEDFETKRAPFTFRWLLVRNPCQAIECKSPKSSSSVLSVQRNINRAHIIESTVGSRAKRGLSQLCTRTNVRPSLA